MATVLQLVAVVGLVVGCGLTFPAGVTVIIGSVAVFAVGLAKERIDMKSSVPTEVG